MYALFDIIMAKENYKYFAEILHANLCITMSFVGHR